MILLEHVFEQMTEQLYTRQKPHSVSQGSFLAYVSRSKISHCQVLCSTGLQQLL